MLSVPSPLCVQLDRVRQRVADRKIKIEVTESAIKLLGVMGYDPAYGARPVKVSRGSRGRTAGGDSLTFQSVCIFYSVLHLASKSRHVLLASICSVLRRPAGGLPTMASCTWLMLGGVVVCSA